MNLQPYQKADLETARKAKSPSDALKIGASVAGSIYGGKVLTKILPFLNNFIPQDLAVKGLSKVDPRIGNFINKAVNNGQSVEDVLNFVKGKMPNDQEGQNNKTPDQTSNIIEQYSPELYRHLKDEIEKGENPLYAQARVNTDPKYKDFQNIIKKMEKDHATPFIHIVESIFGQQGSANSNQSKAALQDQNQQMQQSAGQMGQQGQNAQQGAVDPNLMQVMSEMKNLMQSMKR